MINGLFPKNLIPSITVLFICLPIFKIHAQFVDNFDTNSLKTDLKALHGWACKTGDGDAEMNFYEDGNGHAVIDVDAAKDKRGIWWALIRHYVSADMDLNLLRNPRFGIRVETRIKVSDAPKRVNLHLNTQRTTDFHSNLMEYDIPDTNNWHTISMTLRNFNAVPGDSVYGQMALMDWGFARYRILLDYYKVDIVNIDSIGPDLGIAVPYHPPVRSASEFENHISVNQDAIIDNKYADKNFNKWTVIDNSVTMNLIAVSSSQFIIMRWDMEKYRGKKVKGSGLLELTAFSVQRSPEYITDFGMIRVSEIIGGNSNWRQDEITYNNFCQGRPLSSLINSQMIIDVDVNNLKGAKTFITLSNPVLQRLIDGKTLGIAISPLGAVAASFYAMENKDVNVAAKIHLNFEK